MFLPGAVGAVDAVLTVATSAGDIRYKVQVDTAVVVLSCVYTLPLAMPGCEKMAPMHAHDAPLPPVTTVASVCVVLAPAGLACLLFPLPFRV